MKRILSGLRPTGKVHIGNYFGALVNWIKFQEEYECYYEVADWHVLTTDLEHIDLMQKNIIETVTDWIAAGIDPYKATIFVQSGVKEHAEFHLLLSMLVSVSRLQRNPTLKEQIRDLNKEEEQISYGHLGYPVLQTADILLYDADYVPVGKDQLAHIEIAREIARRFNHTFSTDILKEPQPLLTETPVLPGLDNKKMSKSYGNTIEIGENGDTLLKKIMSMFTDPNKIRANDKGNPYGCVVFAFHKIYNNSWYERETECKEGKIGCVKCKRHLFELMDPEMKKINEKQNYYLNNKKLIEDIIEHGNQKAKEKASKKFSEIVKAVKLI